MLKQMSALLQNSLHVLQHQGLAVFLKKAYKRIMPARFSSSKRTVNQSGLLDEAQEIAFGGERVTHLYPNDLYYAHLSIYWQASKFVKDKVVLDAGCGDGYGTNYLAERGAKQITGIDVSQIAINACQKHFVRSNLIYQRMDLAKIDGFDSRSIDLVFSSNALEHVASVKHFFDKCYEILTAEGKVIIAVPPVVDELSRNANISNLYHLNIWTPAQWKFALSLYFDEVQCYTHTLKNSGVQLNFVSTPDETTVRENDFEFRQIQLDEYYGQPGSNLTIILLASKLRPKSVIPDYFSRMPMIDDSFTRELSS